MEKSDQKDLAFLVKQIGDREFRFKFILVGIADNIQELIGAHESTPRYLKEMPLSPLSAQYLMDIVSNAASKVDVGISDDILYRIAIIGNGFPHFSHLIGKSLLVEAIIAESDEITPTIYRRGVESAVRDSSEELKSSYDAATQRGDNYFKHLIWALADSQVVDVRIDEWLELYSELVAANGFKRVTDDKLRTAIGNFKKDNYGAIVVNTPSRYGASSTRYRFKRFSNTLMRGHVRLQAEREGIDLGKNVGF